MRTRRSNTGFALAVTLVLMALVVIVIVAYLSNTRTDRSASSLYANRLRARMEAESGLAAAIGLLADNTRYGNYITAMPAPSPSPAARYCEVYRPTDSANTIVAKPDDYLRLSNAAGEPLISLAAPTPSGSMLQVDPRPSPAMISAAGPFAITPPSLSPAHSYDFNQVVRLGASSLGRLLNADGRPAYAQWVRLRDSNNQLIGRYAFFVEDESMKANPNVAGNTLAAGSNLRVDDLASPAPSPMPTNQVQELDPAAILAPLNQPGADAALFSLASSGNRLPTLSTLALLNPWSISFSDYAQLATIHSEDDETTARGWQRMDLNKVIADAATVGTQQAKKDAAIRIANWIRDAWTGEAPVASLADYQMYGDEWSRDQIAANIVDYIDTDHIPTDLGDVAPAGLSSVPVIGIEKAPYLASVEIIYQVSGSTYPGTGAGNFSATVKMKVQLRFLNIFDSALDLTDSMGNTSQSRIEVSGIPILQKNGPVYDVSGQTWTIKLSDLTPVNGTGTTVAPGTDGDAASGARSFQTNWLDTRNVSFDVMATTDQKPQLSAANISVKVIGNRSGNQSDDYRIDQTAIVTNILDAEYAKDANASTHDIFKDANSSNGALQVASINYAAGYQGGIYYGASPWDPRYRGRIITDRWNNDSRTDATYPCPWIAPPPGKDRVSEYVDVAEVSPRIYGFDWFDYSGDRPLAFFRDDALVDIGELGNVVACEYPWRSLYLQYPERPASTTAPGPLADIPLRRSNSVDYVLLDLFKTASSQSPRLGAININTQQQISTASQYALAPLFLGEPINTAATLTQTMVNRLCGTSGATGSIPILSHRSDPNNPPDNSPNRPFFKSAEAASVISRLVNSSVAGSGTTGSPGRSTVNYAFMRTDPQAVSESPVNTGIHSDMQVEQEFREVSNSLTTRGNVFRVLYVGQAIHDLPDAAGHLGDVESEREVLSEFLGEALVERKSIFTSDSTNTDIIRTTNSSYKVISNRVITE